ncbi:CotD family spore coat protein [Aquibacillus salsiterrae]|uniref:Spore coat protein n=1 Tax=Aquibacillus salsiterrae TaxID=2950439 RepID=A0A9X3WE11_9BACI|nr:CotD family spore coat protein [Aquibacillus salsiterrae]MDC3415336.1 spore coat protein [Aquibacillus salsiterrae]
MSHKPYGFHHGCHHPVEEVVYPTKYNEVHTCSENTVEHVHPSHTTVVNHHLIKNAHVYPHSTSYANEVDSVDFYAGSYHVPTPPRPNVPVNPYPGVPAPPAPGAVPGFNPNAIGPRSIRGRR